MKAYLRTLIIVPMLLLVCGCVSNQTASKAPSADLSKLKTFYVAKLPKDERGVNQIIVDQLVKMGFNATTGDAPMPSGFVNAVVTYQDKWMWDMTMYMIQLDVQLRDPATHTVLASGQSKRTSLVRKSPEGMAAEVLGKIFAQ